MTGRQGVITPCRRMAKYHWVAVEDRAALDAEEYEDLISKSYLWVFENLPGASAAT